MDLPELDALPAWGSSPAQDTPRVMLVNFWASYCHPCREEMPLLETAFTRHGLAVVGVTRDFDRQYTMRAMAAADVDYPNVSDRDGRYTDSVRAVIRHDVLPVSLLVVDSKIRWVHFGPFHSMSDILKATELSQ